jgi:phage head maturation protease
VRHVAETTSFAQMIYQRFKVRLFNHDHRSLYVRHNVLLVVMKQLETVDIYLAQTLDEFGLFFKLSSSRQQIG